MNYCKYNDMFEIFIILIGKAIEYNQHLFINHMKYAITALEGIFTGVENISIYLLQKCNLRMKNLPLYTIAAAQVFRPFLLLL